MPTTPLHNQDEDEENSVLTQEQIDHIMSHFPAVADLTPIDCCIMAGMLLDMDIPVPVDVIAKAHGAGMYIAH